MEEKLYKLYKECVEELETIGIDIRNNENIGTIDVALSKRNSKRYGCCKQENPDKRFKTIKKYGCRKIIRYEKFNTHHIEISIWVMKLSDEIIKNTIIHEIIHCIPFCNDHGKEFKKYANYINKKLGYDIKRLGNPEEDYEKSKIPYTKENIEYKYKIICKKCGQKIYRKRLNKKLISRYRCGQCGGELEICSKN